ncbi:MAG: YegS/Rv2252/BmrU family lipid kinase [Proteobacteria bacterium]|nr:YegS/Rv2252/BmrU family lipid kinase [Pseudomonadota bacterium]
MNILLIGNPISSGGHAGERIQALSKHLAGRGHQVKTYLTRFAMDGKNNIASLSQKMDCTVVVGGDGTLNEIINGISDASHCPVLHFPTGNANLLAKDLKLPQQIEAIVRLIEEGKTIKADMGTMNGHRFLMVCGMGFDARVTEELKKIRTGKVSSFTYVLPFIRALKTGGSSSLEVDVDGGIFKAEGKAVLVCNVRSYGGICEMAYQAGVDTGVLDVVVLPRENILSILSYLFYAKFSRITQIKDVVYLKAKEHVIIRSKNPIPVELDGDFCGRHPEVRIGIQRGAIPLIAPS